MAECRALLPLPHCHPITFFETRAALCVTTNELISDVRSTVHPPKTAMSVVFLHIATATPPLCSSTTVVSKLLHLTVAFTGATASQNRVL